MLLIEPNSKRKILSGIVARYFLFLGAAVVVSSCARTEGTLQISPAGFTPDKTTVSHFYIEADEPFV